MRSRKGLRTERRRFHRIDRHRAEVPAIRRIQPRPAERFTGANGLNRRHARARHEGLERDAPAVNEVEAVGFKALVKDLVADPEPLEGGAFFEQVEEARIDVLGERMRRDGRFECVHNQPPTGSAAWCSILWAWTSFSRVACNR